MISKLIKTWLAVGLLFGATLLANELESKVPRKAPSMSEGKMFVDEALVKRIDARRANKLRTESITSITSLIKNKGLSSKRKFELFLRLGELYMERHDYIRGVELARFEKAWDKWNTRKIGKEPRANYSVSKKSLDYSVSIFNSLIRSYPKHPRSDVVWYALGSAYARVQDSKAEAKFKYIVKNYPKSKLYPETLLALGEYYFDKFQIPEAIVYYKKMGRYRDHHAFPYSVYKLGWSYYNLKSSSEMQQQQFNTKAANSFKYVINLAKDSKLQSHINLRKESLNDLVVVLADIGDVDSAWKYFSKLGEKDRFYNLLERLGWIYFENGEYSKSAIVYNRLLREAPRSSARMKVYGRLFEIYDNLDQHREMLSLTDRMWKETLVLSAQNPSVAKEWRDSLALKTHRYGAIYHNRAQKIKDKQLFLVAARLYNFYLDNFKNYPSALEIKYNLAELEYKIENYVRSSNLFTEVLVETKNSNSRQSSATGMIDTAIDYVSKSKLPKVDDLGKLSAARAIPAPKKFLMDKITIYTKYYPRAKDTVSLQYDYAYILYEYGHYEPSIAKFKPIIVNHPSSKQAENATRLIMGYYNERKDWDSVLSFSKSLENVAFAKKSTIRDLVVKNGKVALFSKGLSLEKSEKFSESASTFVTYFETYPTDENAEKALYNSVQNFHKANDVISAQKYSETFIATYPKSSLRKSLLVKAAYTYEQVADFEEAAQMYELYTRSYPNEKGAKEALYNAAIMYKAVFNDEKSTNLFSEYLRRYPKAENIEAAYLSQIDSFERLSEFTKVMETYDKLKKTYARDMDRYLNYTAKKYAFVQDKISRAPTKSEVASLASSLKRNERVNAYFARKYLSELLFANMQAKSQSFKELNLSDPDMIERDVRAMQQQLVSIVGQYKDIIKLRNSEYITASLAKIGDLHEYFAAEIKRAPEPVDLSEDELGQYRLSMEVAATPLYAQAKEYYKNAMEQAKDIETISPWPQYVAAKANSLDSNLGNLVDNISIDGDYIVHRFQSEDIEEKFAH